MTTRQAAWIGVIATGAIMLIMMVAVVREPLRLENASAEQRAAALRRGMDLYAFHCAECHGSRGQGEVQEDATTLNDDYIRSRDADWLYKAIARGRNDTEMAAFHIDEGGALNRQQIESLVEVIQHGSWDAVAARVAELGMISEEELALASQHAIEEATADMPVIMVIPTPLASENSNTSSTAAGALLPMIPVVPTESTSGGGSPASVALDATATALPLIMVALTANVLVTGNNTLPIIAIVPTKTADDADSSPPMIAVAPTDTPLAVIGVQPTTTAGDSGDLHLALNLYTTYCAECHGVRGEGVDEYPPLNTAAVQAMSSRELERISFDNPQVEGHDDVLAPDEKLALIALMQQGFPEGE